jgi:hypothetical protein
MMFRFTLPFFDLNPQRTVCEDVPHVPLGYLALRLVEYGALALWVRQILKLAHSSSKTLHVASFWKESILSGSLKTKARQDYQSKATFSCK